MKEKIKEKILAVGADIILHKGFNHTGINELLKAADVSKGSFYFYFDSKEAFGLELIDYYNRLISKNVTTYIQQKGATTALAKLKLFFEWFFLAMSMNNYMGGCLIGNLSMEMADINENFRVKLNETISSIKKQISALLENSKTEKEIDASADIAVLSEILFSSWEGTLLLMKVTKSSTPKDAFFDTIFNKVLK